eukprot:3774466-Amphidinium_carterae.1
MQVGTMASLSKRCSGSNRSNGLSTNLYQSLQTQVASSVVSLSHMACMKLPSEQQALCIQKRLVIRLFSNVAYFMPFRFWS